MKTLKQWRELINKAPEGSGVYIFKSRNRYIYIGKAKNIKKRLLQHLQAVKNDPKELAIFSQSEHLEWIITKDEYEALVLERQLINFHKPKFNIVFKYGSGFPMLVLTEGEYPTLKIVRNFEEKGEYFGPFFTVNQAKRVKKLVHKLFKLRTCDPMPQKGYLCMDYHLGLCSAPCVGKISKKDYQLSVESAKAFLSGEVGEILPKLYSKIEEYSKSLQFEKCALLKDQITALENLIKGQNVLNIPVREADVWIPQGEKEIELYLIRGRKFVGREKFEIPQTAYGGVEEWLLAYYSVNFIPEEVYVSENLERKKDIERYLSEKKGRKVYLSEGYPKELEPILELNEKLTPEDVKKTFKQVLGLNYPNRIEGFDISHFFGEFIVGSCVVWERGEMNKKCYRRYRVRTVEGIDDYKALREVLTRRAKRLKKGRYPMPDMWLIDGGKGQLNVALEVKRLYKLPLFVVSLAKREEILFTEDGREIPLKRYPELYRIFGLIRDEAHRFAVNYNRKLREAKILNKLPQRERKIIERNFGSVYEVINTPEERFKKLGLNPSLKQEIRKIYGDN